MTRFEPWSSDFVSYWAIKCASITDLFQFFVTMLSLSHFVFFILHLIRLISLTKSGQNLIDSMLESKQQLNQFLSRTCSTQYLDENRSKTEMDLLVQKIRFLNELLDNKTPISPYSGTYESVGLRGWVGSPQRQYKSMPHHRVDSGQRWKTIFPVHWVIKQIITSYTNATQ